MTGCLRPSTRRWKLDPNNQRALQLKAASLRLEGRLPEADEVLPPMEEVSERNIMVLRLQRHFDEAESFLCQALARRPPSARLLAERGALLFDLEAV